MRKEMGWTPSVLKSIASENKGTEEIAGKIDEHMKYMDQEGRLAAKRFSRMERRIRELVADKLRVDFWIPERETILIQKTRSLNATHSTPYDVALELIQHFRKD
jgi:putative protein kinase ArgK-like GTPase of G3E family